MIWLFAWLGFVLVVVIFVLATMIGQWTGAAWAYRVGIPFAVYQRLTPPAALSGQDGSIVVVKKGDRFLVRDSIPRLAPNGFVGTVEPWGSGARLRLLTNMNTTFVWGAWAFAPVLCIVVAVAAPNASLAERAVVLLPIALSLGLLWFFVRRARRCADEYADQLGFPSAPSRSEAV